MANDKLLDDLAAQVDNITQAIKWLDNVYYDPEFSTIFNRPLLSMLSQALNFVKTNLIAQGENYREKQEL
jgi:hypothetical protein